MFIKHICEGSEDEDQDIDPSKDAPEATEGTLRKREKKAKEKIMSYE